MVARPRRLSAALAFVAMASACLAVLGGHAHAFGEIDRVAHSLIEIDHPPAPAGAHHVERAVELRHPVCGDCLLVSLKVDGAFDAVTLRELDPSGRRTAAPDSSVPRRPVGRRAPARAPPLA